MASMSSIVRIASAAVVGNDAPSSAAATNASSWKSYDGLPAETLLAGAERGRHLHPVPELGAEGIEDGDLAVVARDLRVEAQHRGREHGTADVRAPAVGQGEVGIHGPVDAGGGELCLGPDHPRPGGQQAQQADRVAAHVHGGAAGQGQLVADVALLPQRGREGHVDLGDVAQLARADDLHQALGQRVVLVVEGLHDDHAWVAVVRLRHGSGLVGVGRERLLAQDVLAGLEGGDGPVPVQAVGERVVDGVDLGVVHQLFVAAQDAGNALLAGEFGGALAVARRHGDDRGAPGPAGGLDQGGGGDAGRPQDPDSQHAAVIGECDPVCVGAVRRGLGGRSPVWDGGGRRWRRWGQTLHEHGR